MVTQIDQGLVAVRGEVCDASDRYPVAREGEVLAACAEDAADGRVAEEFREATG